MVVLERGEREGGWAGRKGRRGRREGREEGRKREGGRRWKGGGYLTSRSISCANSIQCSTLLKYLTDRPLANRGERGETRITAFVIRFSLATEFIGRQFIGVMDKGDGGGGGGRDNVTE